MKTLSARLLACALLMLTLAACARPAQPIVADATLVPTAMPALPTAVPASPTAVPPTLAPTTTPAPSQTPTLTAAPTDTVAASPTPQPTATVTATPTALLAVASPTVSPTATQMPPPTSTPAPQLAHLAPGLNTPIPAPTFGAAPKVLALPAGRLGPATDVRWSADGTRLVTSGFGTGICVYDTATFNRTLLISQDGLATLSADGSQILLVSDTTYRTFDAKSGAPLSTVALPAELKDSKVLAFSPDGRWAVFVTPANAVALWDQATGQIVQRWASPSLSAGFSADSRRLALLFADGVVRVWGLSENALVKEIATGAVDHVALNADGTRLLAGMTYHGPTVWDVNSGQPLRVYNILQGARAGSMVQAAAFSADGSRLTVALAGYGLFGGVDLASGQILFTPSALKTPMSLAFSPDGRRVAAAEGDAAFVWDLP